MTRPLIPELNDAERLIGTETLETFLAVSWRYWTHCSGMKRPYVWQLAQRRAYRKLVELNKALMRAMLDRGDFEDCFVFAKNVCMVHRVRYRPDFGTVVESSLPYRRQLYMGNSCLRGGLIATGGV